MPRSRNPEATRFRILEAATDEFAEHGVAGARYERIAVKAAANKERIYAYFGDKEQLFAAVLAERMPPLAAAHALDSPAGIAEHVGALFDFHAENPALTRLLLWESLHYGAQDVPGSDERAGHYSGQRDVIASALGAGNAIDPGHLSFALTSLVAWWFAAPQVARLQVDGEPTDPQVHARHRAIVMEAASRLLGPPPA